jgi:hypothetical protein
VKKQLSIRESIFDQTPLQYFQKACLVCCLLFTVSVETANLKGEFKPVSPQLRKGNAVIVKYKYSMWFIQPAVNKVTVSFKFLHGIS